MGANGEPMTIQPNRGISNNGKKCPVHGIDVCCNNQQPSACLTKSECKDEEEEEEDVEGGKDFEPSDKSSSSSSITQNDDNKHVHYNNIIRTKSRPLSTNNANELIGGVNLETKQPVRRSTSVSITNDPHISDSDVEFNKPRFITIEDLNDLDTKEMKSYKRFNKDHKIFSFSLPFGQNNKIRNSKISMFNLITPITETNKNITEVDNNKSSDSQVNMSNSADNTQNEGSLAYQPSPTNNDVVDATTTLIRSKTVAVLNEETPAIKSEIKQKLERTNSISSLEELELYKDQTGIENVRNKAIKESLGIDAVRNQIKQITISDTTKTADGYTYGRLQSIWNEVDGDFIIMGGYRGSILRDAKTHRRLWVPIKAGLNLTKIDLYIGPTEQDEIEAQKRIIPDGMLTHIGPVDISRKLIKKLEANPKVHIETFGYDWRLSLEIPCEQLVKRLKQIQDKQKKDPKYKGKPKGSYLLAHSMGGLIAHKVLQDHPELVRGIVYIGAPNQCPNILGPIRFGDSVMWNKSILSSESNFFMRSSHYFLPLDGRCFINRKTYERYDFDFFDPQIWRYLGLSPLVSQKRLDYIEKEKKKQERELIHHHHIKNTSRTTSMSSLFSLDPPSPLEVIESVNSKVKDVVSKVPLLRKEIKNDLTETMEEVIIDYNFKTSYEDSYSYLERTLTNARTFLSSLDYDDSKDYPPLVTVYGNRVPTVRGCKVDGIAGIIDGDYDDFYYGAGDGVVHHSWLLPGVRGFPVVAKIVSETGHVSLMTDLSSMAKALISLHDADKERNKERKQ
ncbi:similar to Saccharomyces cerevisiae YJR098C Putative protein of unknown function [Maudiozyma barnettii]|uniref:Uncharacterized protein n=1 Tax=Maudiozyma barnettii TaxID=61262 RepID=A0A8H2ZIL2_9SACH|nr:hypothetical protein [Kazachstania barnettii]CAB4255632.1 similar to Saccharomyces cerevisiae YJR098C Putative protein of unknown function [Kazachstania barnettii]CAD1784193.1 similar to Saccharomyces cerevisiae YJR098C Putative protein of unknown function [Kazachstania barnettii]